MEPAVKPRAMDAKYRTRMATRSLVKTRVVMQRHCQNIVRMFRDSPVIMTVVSKHAVVTF